MKRVRIWALVLLSVFGFAGTAAATRTDALARWLYETARDLPRSHAPDEGREAELLRIEGISRAVALSVVPYADGKGWTGSELSMALLILIYEETKFDLRIHAGTGHPIWNEDHGLAKCLGQLHSSHLVPQDLWSTLAGTDPESTERCAAATAAVWISVSRQCGAWYSQRASRQSVAATFMAYGSGGSCTPNDRAWARADKWLARMQKRPDRSPIRGYRRVMPSEVIPEARERAEALLTSEDFRVGHERRMAFGDPPRGWAFRVEHHADGKTGVSVFLEESAK